MQITDMDPTSSTSRAIQYRESSKSIFVINPTGICNLRCIHCWNARYIGTQLSPVDVRQVIDRIPTDVRIHFLGGEPLLHPNILELIAYSRRTGHYTSLVTNGLLVSKVGVENLLQSGLSEIGVSIDGPDEVTNDEIRGRGSFSKAWDSLVQISDYLTRQRMDARLLLSVTAMRKNILHIPALIERVAQSKLYVDKVVVDRVVLEGRALETPGLEVPPEMWLDMCEQICGEWRHYRTLFHLVLRGPPLVHNYLTSKYRIFLRDSIIGCPGLESPFSGCLTSEGAIYTCAREFLIRRAQKHGYLPFQGKNYRELITLTGRIFGLPDFATTLGPLLGPPQAPICRDCEWESACVQCPILNLLGEKYSPKLCREALGRMPDKIGLESQRYSESRSVSSMPQILEWSTFSFSNDVYVKQRQDSSITYISPSRDRMVTFPADIHAEFLLDHANQTTPLSELRRVYSYQYRAPAYYLDLVLLKLIFEQFVLTQSEIIATSQGDRFEADPHVTKPPIQIEKSIAVKG